MSQPYVSSIIIKYGDEDNARRDGKILHEILKRQGNQLLIDVIAEHAGSVANKMGFSNYERLNVRKLIVNDMDEALGERL